jgi:hypothetical protein
MVYVWNGMQTRAPLVGSTFCDGKGAAGYYLSTYQQTDHL